MSIENIRVWPHTFTRLHPTFCRVRISCYFSSKNAVNLSSAFTTKRFPVAVDPISDALPFAGGCPDDLLGSCAYPIALPPALPNFSTVYFYGRAKFWCKTVQFHATPCECELGESPSIRNTVQRSESARNSLGSNYESPALTAELQARFHR